MFEVLKIMVNTNPVIFNKYLYLFNLHLTTPDQFPIHNLKKY